MKAPPKRKGNFSDISCVPAKNSASMKAPPKRKGNVAQDTQPEEFCAGLNESPSEKEGKWASI